MQTVSRTNCYIVNRRYENDGLRRIGVSGRVSRDAGFFLRADGASPLSGLRPAGSAALCQRNFLGNFLGNWRRGGDCPASNSSGGIVSDSTRWKIRGGSLRADLRPTPPQGCPVGGVSSGNAPAAGWDGGSPVQVRGLWLRPLGSHSRRAPAELRNRSVHWKYFVLALRLAVAF